MPSKTPEEIFDDLSYTRFKDGELETFIKSVIADLHDARSRDAQNYMRIAGALENAASRLSDIARRLYNAAKES